MIYLISWLDLVIFVAWSSYGSSLVTSLWGKYIFYCFPNSLWFIWVVGDVVQFEEHTRSLFRFDESDFLGFLRHLCIDIHRWYFCLFEIKDKAWKALVSSTWDALSTSAQSKVYEVSFLAERSSLLGPHYFGVGNFLGLGLIWYYQRVIRDFLKSAIPLTRLTKKNVAYGWLDACEAIFIKLERLLTNAPVLLIPEGNQDLVIYNNACRSGLDVVLM